MARAKKYVEESVRHYALNDIGEYLAEEGITTASTVNGDVWNISPKHLERMTTRKMQMDLGLLSTNKHGDKMFRQKSLDGLMNYHKQRGGK